MNQNLMILRDISLFIKKGNILMILKFFLNKLYDNDIVLFVYVFLYNIYICIYLLLIEEKRNNYFI